MSAYSSHERLIAKFLEQFPVLRIAVKYIYQRFAYLKNYSSTKMKIEEGWLIEDSFSEIKGHTFFGYYDKSSFSKSGHLLTHVVTNNTCSIYIKTASGEMVKVAETEAWNWQQGAMATWLNDECIGFNDIVDEQTVFCIYSLKQRRIMHTHNDPLQSYSSIKNIYASISYEKLNSLRPEYGYEKLTNKDCDNNEGIKILKAFSGKCIHDIKLDEIISFLGLSDKVENSKLNHCQFSPSGNLVLFMYRTFRNNGKYSYLLAWDYENNKLIKLMDDRIVSHYSWIDDNKIIVWGRVDQKTGYHTMNVIDEKSNLLKFKNPLLLGDGHPSVCNKNKIILTDTYPDKARVSTLFLLSTATGEEKKIAQLKHLLHLLYGKFSL